MKSHASMNRIYRLVWNAALSLWVAVAENAKGAGKGGSGRGRVAGPGGWTGGFSFHARCHAALGLIMSLVLAASQQAHAADAANASVTAGSAGVSTVGNTTTINQGSQRVAIDWTSLSTRANEALVFNQPNASAIALNRITGSSPSELLGSLTANGQVFILNPNGVLFGAGSQVNVGGLVASTLSMSNADFMDGNHVFTNSGGTGAVVNQGTMTAASGGYLALLAPEVRNEGVMTASLGTALLAAGNKVTLNLDNGSLLGYSIDQGAINALAENKQLIQADGGQVLLSAKAMDSLTMATVNNTGVIEARTIQNKAGRIMLMGDMETGTVNVGGTLDASAPTGGDGGFIETSAAHVKVADSAVITTKAIDSLGGQSGSWLIDPTDFTIAASGGDMTGAALSTQLANNGTVTILNTQGASGTAGDINVNDAVSWSSNSVLTLSAGHDININRAIAATGASGGLRFNYSGDYKVNAPITLSGASSSLVINGNTYTLIRSMAQLDALDANNAVTGVGTAKLSNGFYALAQDLNAAGTAYTRSLLGTGTSLAFGGTFAGLGHTISNLTINAAGGAGLFGYVAATGVIRDIGLVGGSISGANGDVGALAGRNTGGTISNVYASVNVSGNSRTGGLVGYANGGSISNSWASGTASSGGSYVGGLVGFNKGSINNVYAEGAVSGTYAGGLVGYNDAGATISQAYATGAVTGNIGGSTAGGLVGINGGGIDHAYATGAVSGDHLAGGLIGNNSGTVDSVYSTGGVTLVSNPNLGPAYGGGLMGADTGSVSNAAWDSGTSGQSSFTGFNNAGNSGSDITAAIRYSHSAYGNFGTWTETAIGSGVWVAHDAGGKPQWVMVEGSTRPFLYSEWSSNVGNAHQLQLMAANLSASYTLARNIDASATSGTDAAGMWSTAGFASVGNASAVFSGRLDGQNRTVQGLSINRAAENGVGLFSVTANSSEIRNVGLTQAAITGGSMVGALVGKSGGQVSNSYSSGTVNGNAIVGGLVGQLDFTSSVAASRSAASVVAALGVGGGLVGSSDADSGGSGLSGQISGSYATGAVSGGSGLGGLVGSNLGVVNGSYATGNVSGLNLVGGLAGSSLGTVEGSYATGNASGGNAVGGLVGGNNGSIANSYAIGGVTGSVDGAGGLVGSNAGSITNSYATGTVGGNTGVGALAGTNAGSITASFWKTAVSSTGVGDNIGTVDTYTRGLNQAEFTSAATFTNAGWTASNVGGDGTTWRIYEGNTGPLLRSFLTAYNLRPDFDGSGTLLTNVGSYSTAGADPGKLLGTAAAIDSLALSNNGAAGGYDATSSASGLYSTQQGYDLTATRTIATPGSAAGDINITNGINYTNGVLSINAAGNVSLNGISSANGSVALNAGGGITNTGATDVALFDLKAGAWSQVNSTLPSFSATDFRISGGSFLRALGGDGSNSTPYIISDVYGLQGIGSLISDFGGGYQAYSKNYVLANNIDASGTAGWNGGAGFKPISEYSTAYQGVFNGQGYNITGLVINRPTTDYVGLFGSLNQGTVQNVNLVGGSITGHDFVGALVGFSWNGSVIDNGTSAAVSGNDQVGGLVGMNYGNIANNHTSGAVSGHNFVGGLVGDNRNAISGNYAQGNVDGNSYIGGLIGHNGTGTISNSYATGEVSGEHSVGGLIGYSSDSIINSYATGKVTASIGTAGGLVGDLAGANVSYSYSSGQVSGGNFTGGLVGSVSGGTVSDSFWDITTSGQASSAGGGTGKTTAELKQLSTFAGWDIDDAGGTGRAWRIYDGNTGPLLRSFLTARTLADTVVTYNGVTQTTTASGVLGTGANGRNAGAYGNGFYSGQDGYDLSGGWLTINKADLVLGAVTDSKTYDGTTASTATVGKTGLVSGDTVTGLSQSFGNQNVLGGNGSTLAVDAGYVVADGNNGGNYNVSVTTAAGTINKATLTVTGVVADNKTYNASDAATLGNIGTLNGLVSGEVLTLSNTGATFADKNVGIGKLVTATYGLADGSGGLASNYQLAATPVTTTASISQAALTVSGITAADKTYNASDATSVNTAGANYGGLFAGDVVNVAATGLFSDKNAGTNKTVNLNSSYSGADVGNYAITGQATTTASISQAALNISGITASDKTYNASDAATVNTAGANYGGLFAGDAVNVAATGLFSDKNAGTNKTVNLNSSYSGADVGNYAITGQATTTASISQASLTLSTSDVVKTYDAGTGAAGTAIVTGGTLFGGDSLFGGSFAFTNKNASIGDKVVSVSGVTVGDGVNNSNYNVTYAANTTSTINKADLTVQATGASKVYDGTTAAVVAFSGNGLAGDVLNVTGSASFADKNAGLNKAVSVTGIAVGGADAGNYNLISGSTANTTADITPKQLTVTANDDRQMGGPPYSGGNGVSYNGLVTGDTVATVLAGSVVYGGGAQGAYLPGEYDITPGGLLANGNYSLRFVQGRLTLSGGDAASAALGGTALAGAYQTSLNMLSGDAFAPRASLGDSNAAAAALNAVAAEEREGGE